MAQKSWIVHYLNKYPGGRVDSSESHIAVYDASGKLRVRLEKNGAGQWNCVSEDHGAVDKHDLSPIPKDARAHKLYSAGGKDRIGKAEEHLERTQKALQYCRGGKVLSLEELGAEAKAKGAAQAKAAKEKADAEAKAKAQSAAEEAAKRADEEASGASA
jgi:hypothetical protein